jgi:hypothetical protein
MSSSFSNPARSGPSCSDPAFSELAARVRAFMARDGRPLGTVAEGRSAEEAEFNRLALALHARQYTGNEAYRRICVAQGSTPGQVRHWQDIPAVPTSAFKEFPLTSLSSGEEVAIFHSSGTTGQTRSSHHHSAESLAVYEDSLWRWFQARCLAGRMLEEWDLVFLTPPAGEAPNSSLTHMFSTLARHASGRGQTRFCGVSEAGGWALDWERVKSALATSRPVLVLGTAFNFVHLLEETGTGHSGWKLAAGSAALETGGYKGRSQELPKETLHRWISERLGIARSRIVCEYGMSELGSQAYDGELGPAAERADTPEAESRPGCFQFPPWARVRILSPETGREVGEGETGLIRVWDLANVWSVLAVQTGDLGRRRGTGFEWVGRAVEAEPRGCSLQVAAWEERDPIS